MSAWIAERHNDSFRVWRAVRGVIEYHKKYSTNYPSGRIVTFRSLEAARRRADELNCQTPVPSDEHRRYNQRTHENSADNGN